MILRIQGFADFRQRAIALCLSSILACGALAGCTRPDPPLAPPSAPTPPSPSSELPVADRSLEAQPMTYDRFGFALFGNLYAAKPDENIFISPTSIAIALATLYNGARSETQAAIAQALNLEDLATETLNQRNAALAELLSQGDEGVELAIANSLWLNQGATLNREFVRAAEEFYAAEVAELDMQSPQAIARINRWVSDKTQGNIEAIVQQLPPETLLLILNAVYFKGSWTKPFDADRTEPRSFALLDGSQKQHPLMFDSGKYPYYEGDRFQAVRLSYGKSGYLNMYIFLPKPEVNLSEFIANLDATTWQNWIQQFRRRQGTIGLPKFELEYEVGLNDALKTLGMGIAFNGQQADFSGIRPTPPNLFVSNVRHKTFVKVDEEGTEAAAVTDIEIGITSASPEPERPFEMIVDRPFLFAIRDDRSGTVVFLGAVVSP